MDYEGSSQDGTLPDAAMPGNWMLLNRKARRALSRFCRDDRGVMTIFAVYMVLMMLIVCGIGVNLMQNEMTRTRVQSTVDRAVLAAADLQQTLDADDVVLDYFAKAGMSEYISADDITVTPGVSLPTSYYRIVRVEARTSTPVLYMPWEYIKAPEDRTRLPVFASGQAEEVINNVEISLVLDVSGSMNSNSRLVNLKIAAKNFVDEMIDNSRDGRLSISIIPYATQVSIPTALMDEFTTDIDHDYSNCLNFEAADFDTTSVFPTPAAGVPKVYERTLHFDPWYNFDGRDNDPIELVQRPVCEALSSREVLPLTDNRDALKTFIDGLTARGNTSIDVGMKWGTALVDPSIRPAVQGLIAGGSVAGGFATRPRDYDDLETMKVVVLMTDGKNTGQYYIEDGKREGPTNVWWNEAEEQYSVRRDTDDGHANDGLFYWRSDGIWVNHPKGNGNWICGREGRRGIDIDLDGDGNQGELYCDTDPTNIRVDNESGSAVELDYPELWAYTTIKNNLYDNFRPWMNTTTANNEWYYDVFDYHDTTTKDTRTKAICDAAKGPTKRITVYSIGFEAPSSGQSVLLDCASSPSHFFNVQGGEALGNAFEAIAHQITQLRLTQ